MEKADKKELPGIMTTLHEPPLSTHLRLGLLKRIEVKLVLEALLKLVLD